MDALFSIELEPEVRDWLQTLPAKHFLKIDEYVGLLAEHATALGEPYARHLGDGVRELRPTLDGTDIRITYWLAPNRTVVLLTVFRKTRMREDAEVERGETSKEDLRGRAQPGPRGVHPRRRGRRSRAMSHSRYKTLRQRKLAEGFTEPDDVAEARREIRMSMAFAKAVYDRRTELGLTQSELAGRAGLTQAKISRIEGSDTVPTLPLLAKLAMAMDATLNIALDTDDTRVSFSAHRSNAA